MIVAEKDADLFFELMWDLQFYVKEQMGLLPDIRTREAYKDLDGAYRMEVRDAVWENPQLIGDYVKENPNNLDDESLAIVAEWQNFLAGEFYIERTLKAYTVFIQDETVYGVVGLYDEFADMLPKQMLPTYVKAVLLPFKGVIVYDGLLSSYPVFFGGGIKESLKQIYNRAKRKGEIVVSFDAEIQQTHEAKTRKKLKDWKPALNALNEEAKSLRAQSGSPPTWGPAFSMVKASLVMAETAVTNPEDMDQLWEQFDKLMQTANRLEKAIYRS